MKLSDLICLNFSTYWYMSASSSSHTAKCVSFAIAHKVNLPDFFQSPDSLKKKSEDIKFPWRLFTSKEIGLAVKKWKSYLKPLEKRESEKSWCLKNALSNIFLSVFLSLDLSSYGTVCRSVCLKREKVRKQYK